MSSEDGSEDISMSLPQEAELSDAIATTNGTIVYEGDNDATVSVQPLQIEESDLTVMGNRTMVTIENKNASKEYSFEYKLPVGGISWAVTGYAAIQGCRGYSYTKVTIEYEHWKIYRHRAGKWEAGSLDRGKSVSIKPVK